MRKILSLFLAVLLLSFFTITAFSAEENLARKIFDLRMYTDEIQRVYGIYPIVGDVYIDYTVDTRTQLRNDIDSVLEMFDNYYVDRSSVTQEMIDEAYDLLDTSVNNLRVETSELEFLLDICKPEQNINNYYSDEVWAEFQQCLSNAENALILGVNEDEITKVYWDLRYAFNKLCAYNPIMGDVDGNGVVNVNDCTMLSKAVAELTTLNSSQKFVSSAVTDLITLSVNNVTEIQKYLVQEVDLYCVCIDEITENVYSQDLSTNDLLYRLVFLRER